MKLLVFVFFLFSFNVAAVTPESSVPGVTSKTGSAKLWLERLSLSLRQKNFTTSFVVIKNTQAEPYHWLHGLGENGQELEIITRLNGPRRDVLRQGEIVSYIEPEQEPYSVNSTDIHSPIPNIFRQDISELEENYRFISVGRSRILGRVAQFVRIVAKDKYRFGYWLWLDHTTGLLLKMAVVTAQGQILEQIQFTHIEVSDQLSENLAQFQGAELPIVNSTKSHKADDDLVWAVSWLPLGFNVVKSNQHRLMSDNRANDKSVEFMLFTDGLVDISVYVNLNQDKFRAPEFANDGATMVYNHVVQGVEVGVVGDIPLITAKQIAESIVPNTKPQKIKPSEEPALSTLSDQ
jgi:sigma-E factor negative regulatory protein RseB